MGQVKLVKVVPRAQEKMWKSVCEDPRGSEKPPSLCYEEYRHYFSALKNNHLEKVTTILTEADPRQKEALLNGMFDFGTDSVIPTLTLSRISRPFFIAIAFGSVEVVELLLKEGTYLFQENTSKGNVLHSLVSGSSFNVVLQERSVLLYEKILSLLDQDQIRKLLMHENVDGLRPMEMAANLGCLSLYEAMQLTPGVYVTKTLEKGVFKEEWIDITEYETYEPGNRRAKSPTFLLAFLDKTILESPKDQAVLGCDLLSLWMEKKMKCDRFVLLVWAFSRVLYAGMFYLYITKGQGFGKKHGRPFTPTSGNSTTTPATCSRDCSNDYMYFTASPIVSQAMVCYLILHSIINIVTSMISYKFYRKDKVYLYNRKLLGTKNCVMDYSFYVGNHLLTNLMYVLGGILTIFDLQETHTFVNILVVLTCLTSVWSVLYFVQIMPSIGHFAITIQRMIRVLIHFIVVFALTFTPFPHAFYRLLQDQDGCYNPSFSPNAPVTFYNTFTVLLNMVDFTQFEPDLTPGDYVVLLFLHIIYVFVLSILLINFLIALLSSSVAEIHEHKMVVMTIQRMCVISNVERYMDHCACLRSLWRRMQRKHYHVVDGRFYLVHTSLNLN